MTDDDPMIGRKITSFFVAGIPETKGSWVHVGGGAMKRDNPREKAWANSVGWSAKLAFAPRPPLTDRVNVVATFVLPPPIGRGKKNRRDLDKLMRSILDALTGIVYVDDEQVDAIVAQKLILDDHKRWGAQIDVLLEGAAPAPN